MSALDDMFAPNSLPHLDLEETEACRLALAYGLGVSATASQPTQSAPPAIKQKTAAVFSEADRIMAQAYMTARKICDSYGVAL
jgi:hypothetical protein